MPILRKHPLWLESETVMKIFKLLVVLGVFFILTGCASIGEPQHSKIERITPEELNKLLPPPVATVSLEDIITDSKQGKSTDEIIAKIKESDSRYELTPAQVVDLNKQGVDIKVIDYIQQSNELAKQNAIAEEINRRQQENAEIREQLAQERLARHRYYDPFWGPSFYYRHRIPIGPAGRYWRGSRHGWGLSYGRRFGW